MDQFRSCQGVRSAPPADIAAPPAFHDGDAAIIILSIFIRRLPYTVRTTATALRQIAPSLEEAAVSLGYSPFQSFLRITVPLTISGIISEGMLSFVTAINELSSSLVLHVDGAITTPVRIYLLVLSGLAVYIAFRLMSRNEQALL